MDPSKKAVDKNAVPEYNRSRLETLEPGLAWLWPADGYNPSIPAMHVIIEHDPAKKTTLFLNNEEVDAFYLDNTVKRVDYKVAVTLWRGVHLKDGDNVFEVVEYARTIRRPRG